MPVVHTNVVGQACLENWSRTGNTSKVSATIKDSNLDLILSSLSSLLLSRPCKFHIVLGAGGVLALSDLAKPYYHLYLVVTELLPNVLQCFIMSD